MSTFIKDKAQDIIDIVDDIVEYDKDEDNNFYEDGYDNGYQAGYDSGYENGLDEAYSNAANESIFGRGRNTLTYSDILRLQDKTGMTLCYGDDYDREGIYEAIKILINQ